MKKVDLRKGSTAVVILWHPEGDYVGGSFHLLNEAFKQHSGAKGNWVILDKAGTKLKSYAGGNIVVEEYKIPASITKLTTRIYIVGRLLEWLYIFSMIFIKASSVMKKYKVDVIYIPIAEMYPLSAIGYILKIITRKKTVALLHQFNDYTQKMTFKEQLSEMTANNVAFGRALFEVVYTRMFEGVFRRQICAFDKLAAISGTLQKTVAEACQKKVGLLPYGFDYDMYAPPKGFTKQYDAIFIGRLISTKGIDDMISVWTKVTQQCPKARLLIVGDGEEEYKAALHKKITQLELEENMIFKGTITGFAKVRLLYESRLLLFLSHLESYGDVVSEAVATELPIVAYDLPAYESRRRYTNQLYTFPFSGANDAIVNQIIAIIKKPNKYKNTLHKKLPTWEQYAREEEAFVFS